LHIDKNNKIKGVIKVSSFTKKFVTTTPNTDILSMFLSDIELCFGGYFRIQLENHQNIPIGADIICDSDTSKFQIRHTYGQASVSQDLIGGSLLSFDKASVVQIIAESVCSGTITFQIK
jgi:hypothetical protein